MNKFLRFTALCAGLSALTTLLLGILPSFYPELSTDMDRAMLHANPYYMGRLWVNLVHVLLLLPAYLGAAIVLSQRSNRGLASLGFMWFLLWLCTELLGISGLIFAVNGAWRKTYVTADELTQEILQRNIDLYLQVWDGWFFLLLIFFLLGTLTYGIAIWNKHKLDRILSSLFLLGVPLTIFIMVSGYGGPSWPGVVVGWVYPVLQPAVRSLLGVWIWRRSSDQGMSKR